MKNQVKHLATAAPHALDAILLGNKVEQKSDSKEKKQRERACSFDLDLSGLKLDNSSSTVGSRSVGGSIAEEGSVVTFEDLSEFSKELSLDWTNIEKMPSKGAN